MTEVKAADLISHYQACLTCQPCGGDEGRCETGRALAAAYRASHLAGLGRAGTALTAEQPANHADAAEGRRLLRSRRMPAIRFDWTPTMAFLAGDLPAAPAVTATRLADWHALAADAAGESDAQDAVTLLRGEILAAAADEGGTMVLLDTLLAVATGGYPAEKIADLAAGLRARHPFVRLAHVSVQAERRDTVDVPLTALAEAWQKDEGWDPDADELASADDRDIAAGGAIERLLGDVLPRGFLTGADAVIITQIEVDPDSGDMQP